MSTQFPTIILPIPVDSRPLNSTLNVLCRMRMITDVETMQLHFSSKVEHLSDLISVVNYRSSFKRLKPS